MNGESWFRQRVGSRQGGGKVFFKFFFSPFEKKKTRKEKEKQTNKQLSIN
jgi:hypothetical protein